MDMCSVVDGETRAIFDPVFGNYEFYSIDMQSFPVGTYEFKITGTVGSKSDFITFKMILVDPCLTATMTLSQRPIEDAEYVLRDPMQVQSW